MTWVAEVKSITPLNEERQLRTALGQVLRYRQLREAEGRTVRAMIATEVEPSDPSWADLCSREGIALAWGPNNLAVGTRTSRLAARLDAVVGVVGCARARTP